MHFCETEIGMEPGGVRGGERRGGSRDLEQMMAGGKENMRKGKV